MSVTTITSDESFNEAIQGDRVAVKYFATWCRPCKMFAPSYDAAAEKFGSIKFYQMDVDEVADTAEQLNVPGLPSVQLYSGGKLVKTLPGSNVQALEAGLQELDGGASASASAATNQSNEGGQESTKIQDVLISNVAELEEFTKKHSHVLIKCFADWCQPCRLINADWDKWVANTEYNANIAFARVNMDLDDDLGERMGAVSLPTFKFFAEGKDVASLEGTDAKRIEGFVEKFVKKAIKFRGGVSPAAAATSQETKAPAKPTVSASASASAEQVESKNSQSSSVEMASGSKTGLVPSAQHLPFVTPYDVFQKVTKENVYTLVCFIAENAKMDEAQSQVKSVLSSVSDQIAQVYVDANKDVQIADAYGVFKEKCPVFKLLHKGIHFATLYQPTNEILEAKLRELISL